MEHHALVRGKFVHKRSRKVMFTSLFDSMQSESYLYFRIMVLAKTSRNDAFSRDPFHIHKQKSLDNARKAFNEMLEAKNSWGYGMLLLVVGVFFDCSSVSLA